MTTSSARPVLRRCLIFNPAFPVLGGGERYTIALGSVIAESHNVTYAAPYRPDPDLVARLGFPPLDIMKLDVDDFPRLSVEYDLAVVVTTLSIPPPSFAAKSLLVVQFPRGTLPDHPAHRWLTIAKLRRYERIVYSHYVLEWLRQRWKVNGRVLMPGVPLVDDLQRPKERLILAVGRFVGRFADGWNNKRQDVLIDAFSQLPRHLQDTWHLVLAGGCSPSPEMEEFLEALKRQANGLNISFEINVPAARLADLQERARLFWHAAGFDRPSTEPERAEHFGMSTVEAMSHGVIPLVYADGGQVEIVNEEFGRLWHSIPQLVEQTTQLMMQSPTELDATATAARRASLLYGAARFEGEARELLGTASGPDTGPTRRPWAARLDQRWRRTLCGAYEMARRVGRASARAPS